MREHYDVIWPLVGKHDGINGGSLLDGYGRDRLGSLWGDVEPVNLEGVTQMIKAARELQPAPVWTPHSNSFLFQR